MAILNRDEFFSAVESRVGTDTSDECIKFLEDMTDTYNSLEGRASGDGIDWEQKYHELDNSWRERYRHRFYDGGGEPVKRFAEPNDDPNAYDPESIEVEDLFD